jgi:hypothetical protein
VQARGKRDLVTLVGHTPAIGAALLAGVKPPQVAKHFGVPLTAHN